MIQSDDSDGVLLVDDDDCRWWLPLRCKDSFFPAIPNFTCVRYDSIFADPFRDAIRDPDKELVKMAGIMIDRDDDDGQRFRIVEVPIWQFVFPNKKSNHSLDRSQPTITKATSYVWQRCPSFFGS